MKFGKTFFRIMGICSFVTAACTNHFLDSIEVFYLPIEFQRTRSNDVQSVLSSSDVCRCDQPCSLLCQSTGESQLKR